MLLQKQGYIVIARRGQPPAMLGEIIRMVGGISGVLHHPVVVVGESNIEEWNRQRALQGLPPEFSEALFYRVTAE